MIAWHPKPYSNWQEATSWTSKTMASIGWKSQMGRLGGLGLWWSDQRIPIWKLEKRTWVLTLQIGKTLFSLIRKRTTESEQQSHLLLPRKVGFSCKTHPSEMTQSHLVFTLVLWYSYLLSHGYSEYNRSWWDILLHWLIMLLIILLFCSAHRVS